MKKNKYKYKCKFRGVSNAWHPNTASAKLRSCFRRNRKRRDTLTWSFIPDKQFAWKHLFIRFCQICEFFAYWHSNTPSRPLHIAFGPSGRLRALWACSNSFPKNPKYSQESKFVPPKSKLFHKYPKNLPSIRELFPPPKVHLFKKIKTNRVRCVFVNRLELDINHWLDCTSPSEMLPQVGGIVGEKKSARGFESKKTSIFPCFCEYIYL